MKLYHLICVVEQAATHTMQRWAKDPDEACYAAARSIQCFYAHRIEVHITHCREVAIPK